MNGKPEVVLLGMGVIFAAAVGAIVLMPGGDPMEAPQATPPVQGTHSAVMPQTADKKSCCPSKVESKSADCETSKPTPISNALLQELAVDGKTANLVKSECADCPDISKSLAIQGPVTTKVEYLSEDCKKDCKGKDPLDCQKEKRCPTKK